MRTGTPVRQPGPDSLTNGELRPKGLRCIRNCLVLLCLWLFFASFLQGQIVSRNDTKRVHFQERNARAFSNVEATTDLDLDLPEEEIQTLEKNQAILKDPNQPWRNRLKAGWSLVSRVLYRDTRNSRQALQDYLDVCWEYRDSSSAYFHALSSLGFYHKKMGNYDSARIAYERELELSRQSHNQGYVLNARIDLCILMEHVGKNAEAIIEYLDILDSSIAFKNEHTEARCRINLGELYNLEGNYRNAFLHLEKALDICTINNQDGFMAATHIGLGNVNTAIGNFTTAQKHYEDALKWAKGMKNITMKRKAIIKYSILKEKQGKLDEAIQLARTLVSASDHSGFGNELAEDQSHLAELLRKQGKPDSALVYVEASISGYQSLPVRTNYYKSLGIAGTIHLDLGHYDLAEKFCKESYELTAANKDQRQQAANCNCLYEVYSAKQNTPLALRYLRELRNLELFLSDKDEALELVSSQLNSEFAYRHYADSLSNKARLDEVEHEKTTALRTRQMWIIALALGFLFLAVVVTVIWLAYRQNRRQKQDLDRLNKLNQQIFSIFSHDFKGPLTSLKLLAETLAESSADEETLHAWLKDIRQQLTQTSGMLDSLLNWARAELSIRIADKPQADLVKIAREMEKDFEQKLAAKGIRFILNTAPEVILSIHPDLLRILLRNLISNGIKYNRPGGTLTLGFDIVLQQLTVTDTGEGMSKETLEGLLAGPVYSRLGTDRETGFGMGLYITSELIRKLGWSLNIRSEAGKGTTVVVKTAS